MSGKKDLCKRITAISALKGFKRKGSSWIKEGDIFTNAINLQKSQWSDLYYINLIITIKKEYPSISDDQKRLYCRSNEIVDNPEAMAVVLDFENQALSNEERLHQFDLIIQSAVSLLDNINTRKDLQMLIEKHNKLIYGMFPFVKAWLGIL